MKFFFKTCRSSVKIFRQFILGNDRVYRVHYRIGNKLRNAVSTLNMFRSGSDQSHLVRRELLSTRLYLLLLYISTSIVIIYTAISVETTVQTIFMPSQAQYEKSMSLHYSSLQCPCKNISVKHKQFMTINTSFHQVCSSDFVKDVWLDYLFGNGDWYNYDISDLRVRGAAYFGLLSALCMISQKTIHNSAEQFLTEAFVSAEIMPQLEFHAKMAVITQQFETTTSARFSHSLRLLRDITHGSTFISSYFLNWHWWVELNTSFMIFPTRDVTLNNNCSCGTRSDCTKSGGIYHSFSNTQYFAMPGWNVGCSVVETLLRSTLECLYNQICISRLVHFAATVDIVHPLAINLSAMESTLPSRFQVNTMVEDIVNALFVEQWHINVSYPVFYNQCVPIYCSYTLEEHNSFLNIASRLLGLYGGLTVSLRFIAPYLIKLALKIRGRCFVHTVTPLAS